MSFVDSNALDDGREIRADVCIVGAGAAGITLAAEMAGSGLGVCLLESGAQRPDDDVQSLYDLDSVGYPIRENFMSRVRAYGGTCNLWAGRAMKLKPIDLERRPWIADSGWPIGYGELETYYRRAETLLRLPSFDAFDDAFEALEPPARAPDVGEHERRLLDGDLAPIAALWGTKPLRFGAAYKPALRRSRNVTAYLNCNVTEIVTSDGGAVVERLEARTLAGKRMRIAAKAYVLACGGLENARLLLVSRRAHARGVGNEHGVVGRYYLDHPRAIAGVVDLKRPARLPYLLGLPLADGKVQLGLALAERVQREEALVDSYLTLEPKLSPFAEQQYGRTVNVMKVLLKKGHAGGRLDFVPASMNEVREMIYLLTPKEIMPHFLYRYYALLKRAARSSVVHDRLTVINFCEQKPDPASRVYLGRERDRLGLEKLVLDWRVGGDEARSVARLHEALARNLRAARLGELTEAVRDADPPAFTDASHHLGTARMSTDPRRGVVDANCRVHRVANLFVAGGAVFPTAGHANPTLTIVALAVRLADHLKERLR